MKNWIFLTGLGLLSLSGQSQNSPSTYVFSEYPVKMDIPTDYHVNANPGKEILMEITDDQTSFYVEGKKTGVRFNSDSLKAMLIHEYYNNPSIGQINTMEIGGGQLGSHYADKVVLSFAADDKAYIATAYMVYFYINENINSLLFIFDIGENKWISYKGLQDAMIQSLGYGEFTYDSVAVNSLKASTVMPDFWEMEAEADSVSVDDGRGFFTIRTYKPKDSSTVEMTLDSLKSNFKNLKSQYPDGKIKISNTNLLNTKMSMVSIEYSDEIDRLIRKNNINRYYIRRMLNGVETEYEIQVEYPQMYADYYSPIFEKMLKTLKVTADLVPVIVPEEKEKKK